jgi:DNA-binding FrmR family transcriptional regulator
MDSYRMDGSSYISKTAGQNHPGGVLVHFYLPDTTEQQIEITFFGPDGDSIIAFSETTKLSELKLDHLKPGGNLFRWNMQYPAAKDFEGRIFWSGSLSGPKALPGVYKVRLKVNDSRQEEVFKILPDPRMESTPEDLKAQFDFIQGINAKVTEAHESIIEIRSIHSQLAGLKEQMQDDSSKSDIVLQITRIDSTLAAVEKALYQTQNKSGQDPLNYPIRLTNKLAHVKSLSAYGNFRPTAQAYAVRDELSAQIDIELAKFYKARDVEVPVLNRLVRESAADAIKVKKP